MADWACEYCTLINTAASPECVACGLPRSTLNSSEYAGGLAKRDGKGRGRGGKGQKGKGGPWLDKDWKRCPVQSCRMELTAETAEEHINLHRIAGEDVESEMELARLRLRYGLDTDPENASFEQQFEKRVGEQLARGKLSREQAERSIAQMQAELTSGCDRALVPGILPHLASALENLHESRLRKGSVPSASKNHKGSDVELSAGEEERLAVAVPSVSSRGCAWVLCGDAAVHCHGSFGDSGWGCGYRNIQMVAGFLLGCDAPFGGEYRQVLFAGDGAMPPIPLLQEWLDRAWAAGFDAEGAEQLEGGVAHSKKKIGTTECATLLRFFGVRAHICDFHSPAVPVDELESRRQDAESEAMRDNATHPLRKWQKKPRWVPAYEPCRELLEFCWEYFAARQPSSGVPPFCPPLYLQHEGHSRTIIGAERDVNSGTVTGLIVFDPATESEGLLADARDPHVRSPQRRLRKVRRGAETFTHAQYQICVVVPGLADEEEKELLKVISATPPQQLLSVGQA